MSINPYNSCRDILNRNWQLISSNKLVDLTSHSCSDGRLHQAGCCGNLASVLHRIAVSSHYPTQVMASCPPESYTFNSLSFSKSTFLCQWYHYIKIQAYLFKQNNINYQKTEINNFLIIEYINQLYFLLTHKDSANQRSWKFVIDSKK